MKEENSRDKFADLRKRAETMLPTRSSAPDDISVEDFCRVLHELEVHQIELEMQNEELRTTQFELETLYRNYVNLYDFAPVGYLTISDSGLILETNLTAILMLGVEKRMRFSSHFQVLFLRMIKIPSIFIANGFSSPSV